MTSTLKVITELSALVSGNNISELKMDILGELPLEISEIILMYLSPDDLVNIYSVSNRWRQLVNNDHVWSRHLPYHKYTEKYWQHSVGENYDEGEGCLLMRRFLTESRIKNNLKQDNYNVVTSVFCLRHDIDGRFDGRKVWSTESGLLLSNGEQLKFKDTPNINLRDVNMTLSSDLRLLAVPYANFLFIYERKPPTVEFELLSLLAGRPATEEEPDGSTMISVVSCPKLDKESVALFLRSKYDSDEILQCVLFTGVDRELKERRVFLRLVAKSAMKAIRRLKMALLFGLWDVDRNRLVHRWNMRHGNFVQEGWDNRGVCLIYNEMDSGTNRIEFYDVDMRPLTVIHIKEYRVLDLIVSYNFSVADIKSNDGKQLVMWEKDSTEYRVLVGEFKGRIVSAGPSTIAYLLDNNTVAIIAAPDWQTVAHVKTDTWKCIEEFYTTEFSDGSLFIVMYAEKGYYVWHNIERRNTKEISEWPIECGHKLNLPERSWIHFNNGVKLAIFQEREYYGVFSIIDYNK